MNKSELINAVAEKAALSKKDSESAVTAALDAITAALAKTKEEIQIPATKVPSFKPGKALKDVVAK